MKKIGWLLYLFIFVLLVVVNAEIYFSFFKPEYRRDFLSVTEEGNIFNRPNYNARAFSTKNSKGWMWVKTDSYGKRINREESDVSRGTKSPFRVLLFGDSLSFGLHIENKQTFLEQLKQKLESRFPEREIQVFNCSAIAAGLSDLYQLSQGPCRQDNVDLTIVQTTLANRPGSYALFYGEVYGSDQQLLYYLEQCYSDLDLRSSIDQSRFRTLNIGKSRSRYIHLYRNGVGSKLPLYDFSHLSRLFTHHYLPLFRHRCHDRKAPLVYGPDTLLLYSRIIDKYDLDPLKIPSLAPAVDILKRWKNQAKAHRFLVINIPNRWGLHLGVSNQGGDGKGERSNVNFELSKLYKSYLNQLSQNNILYLDLLPPLKNSESNKMYIEDDVHLSEIGHQFIANHLLNTISETGLISKDIDSN